MKEIEKEICIEGIDCAVTLQIFEKEDIKNLKLLFDRLQENNKILKEYSARRHNLHELISEGLACYFLNFGRKKELKLKDKTKEEKAKIRKEQKKHIKNTYGKIYKNELTPNQQKEVTQKFYPKLPSVSFDCVDLQTDETVQVKASIGLTDRTGVLNRGDLTQFGPESEFDKLIFLDFFNNGKINGKFKAYDIPLTVLYSTKITEEITLTQRLQQKAGKNETKSRPHFSIIEKVITPNGIEEIDTYDLNNP